MAQIAELICNVSGKGTMQLSSLSASEGLSRPFEYQVDILCDKSDLELPKFLGQSMTVALELPDGKKRYFNGLVSRFGHSGRRTKQFHHYQATLRPWLWFLSRTQDCKIFQQKTVVQIVEEVFADHAGMAKVKKQLTGSYTPWDYCVQYRESDLNFVARLLEQEGIYYYFNHTEGGHELVLCDSASAHSAVPGYEQITYGANWTEDHDALGEVIHSWSSGVQVLPTKVVLADYDFERPSVALRKDSAVARQHDLSSYEVFDYPGEYTQDGDGVAYAKSRAQEQQAGYQVCSGQADARGMSCGSTFKVKGLPGASLDGEYLVLSTNIYIEEGVQMGGEDGRGHYSCDFQVMPTADKYRAPRLTPKPMVYGPQTAVVVGPSAVKAHDVHTDKYGRIKVQFHWDRLGKKDDKSSCWIRVSQPWAGKNFGIISLPRVGDEVVVSFLEGDPDQPLVTGRVYNAENMPPYELPANASVTTVLTRSMASTDQKQANELRFEDKPGKEYIWLQAQKDFHREVENDDHDTVKNDQYIQVLKKRHEEIGADLEQTVGGNVKENYGADQHLNITGDYIHETGGVINLKAGGDYALESGGAGSLKLAQGLDVKAGMDLKAQAGMNVHLKGGMNVTIEAGMTLTLKAGAGSIVIGPATISIDAPMVNINGGGGGGAASAASPVAPAKPQKAVKPKQDKDPLTPGTSAAAKSAPAAKSPAAAAGAPTAKKAPAAKKATSAKSAAAPAAAKSSSASAGTSGMIVQKKGAAYKDDQIVKHSHYNDPIDTTGGRLAGNSRIWGDASPQVQQASIDALVNSSKKAGLGTHDTAMVLAIARTESGFNPDAAAGTTSASGLGQFVDRTGKAYGLNADNRWDVNAQADALVNHYIDNKKLAEARGLGDEYIYKYHHDGPTADYGGLGISEKKVMPLAKAFEAMLSGG